jgi:hypothetical protein
MQSANRPKTADYAFGSNPPYALGDNTRETVLDAFEVYEDALRNLFGGHRDRIEALKTKIRTAKGK